jgi:hypothetical protein
MIRDGVKPVGRILQRPKLPTGLILYYEAFFDLDTERNHGMGFTAIPWSAIVRYGEYYELDTDELIYFIRKIDNAHLERLARESKSGKNTTRPSETNGSATGQN